MTVLDSSAVLAVLQQEPGAEVIQAVVGRAVLSTVNLVEVIDKLVRRGSSPSQARNRIERMGIRVATFTEDQAIQAADFLRAYRNNGLSLADCACLALAEILGRPVLTTDKDWAKLGLTLDIRVIR